MNHLKEARKAKRLTQVDVARYIGITQGGYSGWESGATNIDSDSLAKLASLFDVTVDYLIGETDNPGGIKPALKIPVLGSVPAGIPIEAIEDIVDWEEIPAAMAASDKDYFALKVKGDSMWPEILDGDVVIVERRPCCKSGDIAVVYINGYDATLKQVKMDEDAHTLTLVPRNQNYAPRTFTADEIRDLPVSIAGVVVELRRKIKK